MADLRKTKIMNKIIGNDKNTRFFTGLQSWNVFNAVFELVRPGIEDISGSNIEKCALPLKEQNSRDRRSTIHALVRSGLNLFFVQRKIHHKIPHRDQSSRAQGVLKGSPKITEDTKYIAVAEDSNILTKLLPGNQVLADRGFLVEEYVARYRVELVTPAFKGTREPLTVPEIEKSRIVFNVRIHVERVIGQLRLSYTILHGKLKIDSDKLAFIDKIAFVCCCLFNCNASIVQFC